MSLTSRGRAAFACLVLLAWLAVATVVSAHAVLQATFPESGGTVTDSPRTVAARFSEALEPNSAIELVGPDGASIAEGGLDPDDPRRLLIRLDEALANGEYEARWVTFSGDGHSERGTFTFTVDAATAPSATPSPAASAPTSAEPTAVPTAEPTEVALPSPTGGGAPAPTSGTDLLIPIVALVALVGGFGAYLLRSRR